MDGRPITVADFTAEMARRGGERVFPTDESRRAMLDDMVRVAVLAANGRARGYLDDYDVRRDIEHLLAGRYQQEEIEPPLAALGVTDDEVDAYYRAHPERFTIPAAARGAIIFFGLRPNAPPEAEARVRERVAQVQAEAAQQQGETLFGALAAQHSDDQASRYFGGDTGWIAAGQTDSRFEPAVIAAIFALDQPGQMAPLVETTSGLYLVRLVEKKPAVLRPLEEVAPAIRAMLLADKRRERSQALYAAAAARVPVEIHADRLPAGPPGATPAPGRPAPPPVPQL
ncbi:MAG: peptidyl-prolyl cis-trans isomerase [Candidatus Binatia bacterium]